MFKCGQDFFCLYFRFRVKVDINDVTVGKPKGSAYLGFQSRYETGVFDRIPDRADHIYMNFDAVFSLECMYSSDCRARLYSKCLGRIFTECTDGFGAEAIQISEQVCPATFEQFFCETESFFYNVILGFAQACIGVAEGQLGILWVFSSDPGDNPTE